MLNIIKTNMLFLLSKPLHAAGRGIIENESRTVRAESTKIGLKKSVLC